MKRSIALALLIAMGIFAGSAAIPAMADCGTCDVGDAPPKEKHCPECEKMEDGEKCPKCDAKKKEDAHDHEH